MGATRSTERLLLLKKADTKLRHIILAILGLKRLCFEPIDRVFQQCGDIAHWHA